MLMSMPGRGWFSSTTTGRRSSTITLGAAAGAGAGAGADVAATGAGACVHAVIPSDMPASVSPATSVKTDLFI
jgi:hypothetical protein